MCFARVCANAQADVLRPTPSVDGDGGGGTEEAVTGIPRLEEVQTLQQALRHRRPGHVSKDGAALAQLATGGGHDLGRGAEVEVEALRAVLQRWEDASVELDFADAHAAEPDPVAVCARGLGWVARKAAAVARCLPVR
jgi:hypothetical protein